MLNRFGAALGQEPVLWLTLALITGVILVNGWTDAPNAIATCVATRALGVRRAIGMAAVMNFLGVLVTAMIHARVAATVYTLVDFGPDAHRALLGLCAAMTAIVIWAVAAWYFGIPTSESHALIAGLTGAALGMQGSLAGVNAAAWAKVWYGLALSTGLGLGLGFVLARLVEGLCYTRDRRRTDRVFKRAQIAGGAAMAFCHGAQDGQKFLGVFLLGCALARGQTGVETFAVPLWLVVYGSVVMALGTSIGGYRIIKAVGMDMVHLERYQGFAADAAGAICLLLSTVTGLPVSTTHTKTTAVMGVGLSRGRRAVNWLVVRDMALAWVLTFPGCGLIGFVMVRLFV